MQLPTHGTNRAYAQLISFSCAARKRPAVTSVHLTFYRSRSLRRTFRCNGSNPGYATKSFCRPHTAQHRVSALLPHSYRKSKRFGLVPQVCTLADGSRRAAKRMCTLLRRFVKENKSLLQPSADTARHFLARRVGCTSRQVDCSSRAQLDEIGPDTRIEKKEEVLLSAAAESNKARRSRRRLAPSTGSSQGSC